MDRASRIALVLGSLFIAALIGLATRDGVVDLPSACVIWGVCVAIIVHVRMST